MLFLFLATTLVATALPSSWTAPVELQNCRMTIVMATNNIYPATPQNGGVEMTFVNHATKIATELTFRVSAANRTDQIVARGKYTPGLRIVARFSNFAGTDFWREEPDECKLMRITFADGSTWTAPELRSTNYL